MIYALNELPVHWLRATASPFPRLLPHLAAGLCLGCRGRDGGVRASLPTLDTKLTHAFQQQQVRPIKGVYLDQSIKDILRFSADVHESFNREEWDLNHGNCLVCWELCRCEIISCKMRDEVSPNT